MKYITSGVTEFYATGRVQGEKNPDDHSREVLRGIQVSKGKLS